MFQPPKKQVRKENNIKTKIKLITTQPTQKNLETKYSIGVSRASSQFILFYCTCIDKLYKYPLLVLLCILAVLCVLCLNHAFKNNV